MANKKKGPAVAPASPKTVPSNEPVTLDSTRPRWYRISRLPKRYSDVTYTCDAPGCDDPANTAHFLPWCVGDVTCYLACADHDPGGYWLDLPPLIKDLDASDYRVTSTLGHLDRKGQDHEASDAFTKRLGTEMDKAREAARDE